MRTSLNEIKAIDDHLFNNNDPGASLLFQAKMLLNADLRQKVALQQTTHQVVQQYARKQLKAEIEAVHQKLMAEPKSFMQKLLSLFSSK